MAIVGLKSGPSFTAGALGVDSTFGTPGLGAVIVEAVSLGLAFGPSVLTDSGFGDGL